ncbi:MAG: UDP-N-acetylmuramoyl-tripeptide--D-alanyl-D-alanine ligase [Gammaproteobacteria bacterium]
MQLSDTAQVLNARREGADGAFRGVSTDTRTLQRGNLFVALEGPRFDGHDYLEQAHAGGAAGAAVTRHSAVDLTQLLVDDTRLALGRLGGYWRSRFAVPVIGITGSNGKTTVKEMTAAILGGQAGVLATRGNLNNDIGVPLTLFGLGEEHRAAVIEMGANHAGEIAYLAGLARPTVGVVTNAGPAHLEGFGSLEGVAHAKGEMFSALADDAVAILNADDPYASLWRQLAGSRRVVDFGLDQPAAVSADWKPFRDGSRVALRSPWGAVEVQLAVTGRHNVLNALAASAAALAAGAGLEQVRTGLEAVRAVSGRLTVSARNDGLTVIDDTYNANPASLDAALQVLAQRGGDAWVVLGDMAELGGDAAGLHAQMGERIRQAGVSRLYALGDLAARAAAAFGAGAEAFRSMDALLAALVPVAMPPLTVLVKGSRRMGMERAVAALLSGVAMEGQTREGHRH